MSTSVVVDNLNQGYHKHGPVVIICFKSRGNRETKLTGISRNSIRLSLVLSDLSMNEVDDISPDGSSEDCWKPHGYFGWLVLLVVDTDQRPMHCGCLWKEFSDLAA